MGNHLGKEITLATALKRNLDKYQNEINLEKSAEIFHQLGLLYQERSPDKISLIQSATLLKAASLRQPNNIEFKNDVLGLCRHVLQLANAKHFNCNLVKVSVHIATRIRSMRGTTKELLNQLEIINDDVESSAVRKLECKKIEDIELLQNYITQQYVEIMDFVSNKCAKIMGNPPCEYAVAGMGSIARKEITPYSDFEHIIILEDGVQHQANYNEILEYFRYFSLIFQIIIINLGETIIPSVAIPILNNFSIADGDWFFDKLTTRGISFDGLMPHACKSPLGRTVKTEAKPWTTELIKPVSEMVKYLSSEEDIKNGYHLADILSKTCYVSGNTNVYKQFSNFVNLTLKCSQNSGQYKTELLKQFDEDLKNFDVFKKLNHLRFANDFNIKKVVYRSTTLFISALGRFNCLNDCSCFDIVRSLKRIGLINDETAHHLLVAVAIACEVRLKAYMKKKRQDDLLLHGNRYTYRDERITPQLVEFVGERSLIRYFEVALDLQDKFKRNQSFVNNITIKSNFSINKFCILCVLGFYDRIICEGECLLNDKLTFVSKKEHVLLVIYVANAFYVQKHFVKAIVLFQELLIQYSDQVCFEYSVYAWIGSILYELKYYKSAAKYFERIEFIRKRQFLTSTDVAVNNDRLVIVNKYGWCKICSEEYAEAHNIFVKVFQCTNYLNDIDQVFVAECLCNISESLLGLGNGDQALKKATEAFNMYKRLNPPKDRICNIYRILGLCYYKLNNLEEALKYFKKQLSIHSQFSSSETHDENDKIAALMIDLIISGMK